MAFAVLLLTRVTDQTFEYVYYEVQSLIGVPDRNYPVENSSIVDTVKHVLINQALSSKEENVLSTSSTAMWLLRGLSANRGIRYTGQ